MKNESKGERMLDLRQYIFKKDGIINMQPPYDGGRIFYDSTLDEAYDIAVYAIHRFKNNALTEYREYIKCRIKSLHDDPYYAESSDYIERIHKAFGSVCLILEDEKGAGEVLQLMMQADEPVKNLQDRLSYSIYSPSLTISGACISLAACYAIDTSGGITADLASSAIQEDRDLYKSLEDIWNNAQENIHPFQWGHTHQGSKHCGRVLDNFELLKQELNLPFTNKDFGLLSIACAVHDVAKMDTIRSSRELWHATEAKEIVLQSHRDPLLLDSLNQNDRKIVANIVRAHNNELTSAKIIDDLTSSILDPGEKSRIERLLSIFQLADIMDTTHKRVSEPLRDVLWLLHVNTPPIVNDPNKPPKYRNEFQKLLDKSKVRLNIDVIDVAQDSNGTNFIEVKPKPSCSPGTQQFNDVKDAVKYDNDELTETGSRGILKDEGWPFELRMS